MTDREKLIELCEDVILSCRASLCADCEHSNIDYPHCMGVHFADHLLANGVVVREKGEWMEMVDCVEDGYTGEYYEEIYYNCLNCDYATTENTPFCPNCGADMRKGENDGM